MGRFDSPITPDEISIYLDRELDPRSLEKMAERFARDPDAARRLAAYRRRDEALRQAFAQPSIALNYEFKTRKTKRVGRLLVAAALPITILLSLFVWLAEPVTGDRMAGVLADARTAHSTYAGVGLANEFTGDLQERSAAYLSTVLRTQVRTPNLGSIGFELAGAWQLPTKDGVAAVLAYRGPDGRTITCYFKQVSNGVDTSFAVSQAAGVNAVYRIDDNIAYAVVGSSAPEVLMRAAELGYRELQLRK